MLSNLMRLDCPPYKINIMSWKTKDNIARPSMYPRSELLLSYFKAGVLTDRHQGKCSGICGRSGGSGIPQNKSPVPSQVSQTLYTNSSIRSDSFGMRQLWNRVAAGSSVRSDSFGTGQRQAAPYGATALEQGSGRQLRTERQLWNRAAAGSFVRSDSFEMRQLGAASYEATTLKHGSGSFVRSNEDRDG